MLPITILPRASILTSLVVAAAIASGLALGVAAGGAVLLTSKALRS